MFIKIFSFIVAIGCILFGILVICGIIYLIWIFLDDTGILDSVGDFIDQTKDKLFAKDDMYKDFIKTTESYGRVVELPFSVVQPLLRDNSPMILTAQSDRLAIKDESCRNGIYIKLSKSDYNEYINFLAQKIINKRNLKKTENTLAATQLINKELKRINDEALKSVKKEVENLNNLADMCQYVRTEELLFDEKPIEEPKKFDQELLDKIWNGTKVIIIRDEPERGVFNACHFDNVIRYRGTSAPITDPIFARYLCNDNEWIVSIATPFLVNIGINMIDLEKRCPDFAEVFKRKIKNEGVRYDRL